MEGVTADAAVAQLAKLRADLAEREADREELIRNHSFDMQQAGYDQLSQDAQETLDDTLHAIEANAVKEEEVVNMMLGRLTENYSAAYTEINSIIDHTGTVVGENADAQGLAISEMLGGMTANYQVAYDQINSLVATSSAFVRDTALESLGQIGSAIDAVLSAARINIGGTFDTIADSISKAVDASKIDLGYGNVAQSGTVANVENTIKNTDTAATIAQ